MIANVVGMTQMNPPVKDLREYHSIIDFSVIDYFCSPPYDTNSP